ncbi:hypothetical protein [Vibrio sp. WXL103]|uniref:hypothetical protein n=1 Tax=unclassified Vibrio TaxID=2614977 RepID=UPI003EC6066C
MNKAVALTLSSIIFSVPALAERAPTNLLTMDGDDDIILVTDSARNARAGLPRRTNFFTGIEHSETAYTLNPKNSSTRFIIADGSTRINKNFRMRFVLAENHVKNGNPQKEQAGKINYTLAPRYERWVSPRFSYFAEPVFMRRVEADGSENKEIKLKPGVQFTVGKHFINSTAEYKMIERKRYKTDNNGWNKELVEETEFNAWSAETNYTYRYSPKFNFGAAFMGNGTFDNSWDARFTRNKNWGIRPFVRYRHFYDITTEVNFRVGRNESGAHWAGHDSFDWNINNNMPINRNVRLVANIGYRSGTNHNKQHLGWGDREGMQGRVGVNLSF